MAAFNVLVSFAVGEREVLKYLRPGWRVLLDSGAYTNFRSGRDVVTLDAYVAHLKEYGSAYWRYFALDKIADNATSKRNLDAMLRVGLRPIGVFQRGGTLSDLEELKRVSEVVAVGGIAGRLRSNADRRYLHQVVRAAKGHPVHLLGCGSGAILRRYRPFSADSSGHATRHGCVWLWHGHRMHELKRSASGAVRLDRRPISAQRSFFAKLCAIYGIDPALTMHRHFYGSELAKTTNIRSYIRFQVEMRRLGVEYFIAVTDSDRDNAVAAWELEKDADVHAAA